MGLGPVGVRLRPVDLAGVHAGGQCEPRPGGVILYPAPRQRRAGEFDGHGPDRHRHGEQRRRGECPARRVRPGQQRHGGSIDLYRQLGELHLYPPRAAIGVGDHQGAGRGVGRPDCQPVVRRLGDAELYAAGGPRADGQQPALGVRHRGIGHGPGDQRSAGHGPGDGLQRDRLRAHGPDRHQRRRDGGRHRNNEQRGRFYL